MYLNCYKIGKSNTKSYFLFKTLSAPECHRVTVAESPLGLSSYLIVNINKLARFEKS